MNYIPGFSNYLAASVPRYANGGPVAGDVALTPEQRAARRAAANTPPPGTSITGPTAGEKPLSFGTDNTFNVGEGQEVRVVDAGGNVIFSGFGAEGAKRAVAVGQSLSDDLGKNANFKIQKGERTINPDGSVGGNRYIDVARAAPMQSGLGFLADNVLPFAASFIPVIGPVAGAALGSAVSSGLQGRSLQDALKRAAIAGATAGAVKVSGLDTTIGGALSGAAPQTAGPVAGQVAGQALGAAGDPIVVSGLTKALQSAGGALGSAALSQAGNAASRELSGYKTPAEKFAQQPSPVAEPMAVAPEVPYDGIKVIGPKLVSGSGLPFGAAFSVPVNEMLSGALTAAQPTPVEKTAEEIEFEKNPIVVKSYRPINPVGGFNPTAISKDLIGLGGSVSAGLPALTELAMDPTLAEPAAEDIVVTGNKAIPKTVVPDTLAPVGSVLAGLGLQAIPTPDPALTKKPLGVEDYLSLAGKGVGLLGNIVGGGGAGQSGTYNRGGGSLNPIFSAKLPSAGGLGTIGANRTPRALGDQDWLTYGTRPELNFFDYAQAAAPARPAPITTPIPNEPRGPSMYAPDVDNMRFARGGAMPARRGGSTERTEFAVNGPGTGRSDDIPAVLSDGEYVIDAETVALLGDGSSKAGAKKLDELRVKVRKHKGKKLAKGRFSANAKKPEAYLSGGRV
jgi:hypothetical protein